MDDLPWLLGIIDDCELVRINYLRQVYGHKNVTEIYTNFDGVKTLVGLQVHEQMSVESKDDIANRKWIAILSDIECDASVVSKIDNIKIPHWSKIENFQSLHDESELPAFSGGDTREEVTRYSHMKIKLLHSYNDAGFIIQKFSTYLFKRARNELNPRFVSDPLFLIYILKYVFVKTYGYKPQILTLLKCWMDKYGKIGDKYKNIIRISSGRIAAWSTDSLFLKRLSVVINTLIVSLFHQELIHVYNDYHKVIDEVSTKFFLDPITGIRSFKQIHGLTALFFCTYAMNDKRIGYNIKLIKPSVRLPDPFAHNHTTYDFNPEMYENQNYIYYKFQKVCIQCQGPIKREVIADMRTAQIRKALRDAKKEGLANYYEFVRLHVHDFENELSALLLSGMNALMTLTGFTETNKTVDILKTYNQAQDSIKKFREQLKNDKDTAYIHGKFQDVMRLAYENLTHQSIEAGLYPTSHRYHASLLSMVTGKSAGVGTYTMQVNNDRGKENLNKSKNNTKSKTNNVDEKADQLLSFTDKRLIALMLGSEVFTFSLKRDKTMSYKDWSARFKNLYQMSVDEYSLEKGKTINPRTFVGMLPPLNQLSVGVRSVPGGRAQRAIYIQTIFRYVLERLLFVYVELFRRPPKHVSDKYINMKDCGSFNIQAQLDNTEDFLAVLVMISTNNEFILYGIDFQQFDMTQNFDLVLKCKFQGMSKAFNDSRHSHMFKEIYGTLDGNNANLPQLLSFMQYLTEFSHYCLQDGDRAVELFVTFLASGTFPTFNDNGTNNQSATSLVEERCTLLTRLLRFLHVRIAGDDNGGAMRVTGLSDDEIKTISHTIVDVPTKCGFTVNTKKTAMGQRCMEMAKIGICNGYVLRLGNTQLFESEKETHAGSIVEQLRGLSNKFQLFAFRYPTTLHTLQTLQSLTFAMIYRLDVTGKQGTGQDRSRKWFFPVCGVHFINSDVEGGLGATVTGMAIGELPILYYIRNLRPTLAKWNFVATHINFKAEARVKDLMSGVITTAINDHLSKPNLSSLHRTGITAKNPSGNIINNAFMSTRSILASNEVHRQTSMRAYKKLRSSNVRINADSIYMNFKETSVKNSVNAALTNQKRLVLNHLSIVNDLVSHTSTTKQQMDNITNRFPLLGHYSFIPLGDITVPKHSVQRYCTTLTEINRTFKYYGLRYDAPSPSSIVALKPYSLVLDAARKLGTYNPGMTEESLRDIINNAIMSPASSSNMLNLVKDVLNALFGDLPDLDTLSNGIIRDSWGFSSTAVGFTPSGSLLAYADVSQSNVNRLLAVPDIGSHKRLVINLFMHISFALSILYNRLRYIQVIPINELHMLKTANASIAHAMSGSSTKILMGDSYTTGL